MQLLHASTSLNKLSFSWHLTHVDNLKSIFLGGHGILCKNELMKQQVTYEDIAMQSAQQRRQSKLLLGRAVHDFVPTFVTQRNPMMYTRSSQHAELVWLKIDLSKVPQQHCITSRYNVAATIQRLAPGICPPIINWDVMHAQYWTGFEHGSAARGAEILVHHRIPLKAIAAAEVANPALLGMLEEHYGLPTQINPAAFFYNAYRRACA